MCRTAHCVPLWASAAAPPAPLPAVSRVQARFNAFVRTFKESGTDEEPKYMQLLQEVGGALQPLHAAAVCGWLVPCRQRGYCAGTHCTGQQCGRPVD